MIYCTAKLTKISKTEAKTEVEWKDNALVIITTKDIKIIPVNDINMVSVTFSITQLNSLN